MTKHADLLSIKRQAHEPTTESTKKGNGKGMSKNRAEQVWGNEATEHQVWGDEAAEHIERYVRLIILRITHDPAAVEDLTRETFDRIFQNVDKVNDKSTVMAWII